MTAPSLVITGAGIGGLATALATSFAGWNAQVFERATVFSEEGAGVQLGPNVMGVLHGWGLQSALRGVAAFPSQLQVKSAVSGRLLARLPLADMSERYGAPYATLHRADLHAVLLSATQQYGVVVTPGADVSVLAHTDRAVDLCVDLPLIVPGREPRRRQWLRAAAVRGNARDRDAAGDGAGDSAAAATSYAGDEVSSGQPLMRPPLAAQPDIANGASLRARHNDATNQREHSGRREPQGSGHTLQTPLLVGADGLWSRVRAHVVLADMPPRPTGHLAYRALIAQNALPLRLRSDAVTAWLGPRFHAVQYPVRGGDWLNLVVIVQGQISGDPTSWDHSANALDLMALMAPAHADLQDTLRVAPAWRLWPLFDRPPMTSAAQQSRGAIALVGDAAHPMRPYLAQGAGMAIEDAAALGRELARALERSGPRDNLSVTDINIPEALGRFAANRWQRNAAVQTRAARNGQIFHMRGPLAWARNAALALGGARVLDMPWLYGGG